MQFCALKHFILERVGGLEKVKDSGLWRGAGRGRLSEEVKAERFGWQQVQRP